MSRIKDWLAGLPAIARWAILGGVAAIALLILVSAGWSWLQYREAAAQRTLAPLASAASQAIASSDKGALDAAAGDLKRFLEVHPRSRVSAEACYVLGNVEFQRRDYDAALAAYAQASRQGRGTIAALSQLDMGYAREAKGDPRQALEAYERALAGGAARSFLYPDLLLAKARVQEQLGDAPGAIETYRRFLRDLPGSSRGDEVRGRLALLGAAA